IWQYRRDAPGFPLMGGRNFTASSVLQQNIGRISLPKRARTCASGRAPGEDLMDRQKKLLLFGAAWVSALLLTWLFYAQAAAPRQEKMLRVVVASRDMPVGTQLNKSNLKLTNYPEKDVPKGVAFKLADAEGRVAMVPLSTNEPILQSKISATTSVEGVSSTIPDGYRAMSVQITDVSGVAGLIQPGSKVDVLFTRPGSMAEATTSIILQDVKVLSTG